MSSLGKIGNLKDNQMVLLLCSTVFLRDPIVYVVDIVQMFVRDSDIES